ncbi:MAG: hypothetical protein WC220_14575 [Pedobacter sp.]|jgi:hypothetical protein
MKKFVYLPTDDSDEKNPQFLFSLTHNELLTAIVNKLIDPVKLAKKELANRGFDTSGKWIGFHSDKNNPNESTSLLADRARKILDIRKLNEDIKAKEKQEEKDIKLLIILESFELEFKKELPLLKDAGITWDAHFKTNYEHDGAFIGFIYKSYTLRMDYSQGSGYRYECPNSNERGSMRFGYWPKNDFIVWIYEYLIKPGDLPL